MPNQDIDHQSIAELRAMARIYVERGKTTEASAVLKLAAEIEARLCDQQSASDKNVQKTRSEES